MGDNDERSNTGEGVEAGETSYRFRYKGTQHLTMTAAEQTQFFSGAERGQGSELYITLVAEKSGKSGTLKEAEIHFHEHRAVVKRATKYRLDVVLPELGNELLTLPFPSNEAAWKFVVRIASDSVTRDSYLQKLEELENRRRLEADPCSPSTWLAFVKPDGPGTPVNENKLLALRNSVEREFGVHMDILGALPVTVAPSYLTAPRSVLERQTIGENLGNLFEHLLRVPAEHHRRVIVALESEVNRAVLCKLQELGADAQVYRKKLEESPGARRSAYEVALRSVKSSSSTGTSQNRGRGGGCGGGPGPGPAPAPGPAPSPPTTPSH